VFEKLSLQTRQLDVGTFLGSRQAHVFKQVLTPFRAIGMTILSRAVSLEDITRVGGVETLMAASQRV
jgi:hypothetical protein